MQWPPAVQGAPGDDAARLMTQDPASASVQSFDAPSPGTSLGLPADENGPIAEAGSAQRRRNSLALWAAAKRSTATMQGVALVVLAGLAVTEGGLLLGRRASVRASAPPVARRADKDLPLPKATAVGTAGMEQAAASPAAASVGRLSVSTQPPGAAVLVDGRARGVAPLSMAGLAAGDHEVTVRSRYGELRQRVRLTPGESLSVVVPLASVPSSAPAVRSTPALGILAVRAPLELRIYEGDELVGTSAMLHLSLPAGSHSLTLRNDDLGFQQARTVVLPAGKTTTWTVDVPTQKVAVNAVPWAAVWVDQRRVGETPLGALNMPIGPHVVVFQHPNLGEKTVRLVVRADEPGRVSVDMRK